MVSLPWQVSVGSPRPKPISLAVLIATLAAFALAGCKSKCPRNTVLVNGVCKANGASDAAPGDPNALGDAATDGGIGSTTSGVGKAADAGVPMSRDWRDASAAPGARARAAAGEGGEGEPGATAGAGGAEGMPAAPDAGSEAAAEPSEPPEPMCGNGVREGEELCDGADCKTECPAPGMCVKSVLTGAAASCNAQCENSAITTCEASDGCCPEGCKYPADDDCSPSCGDGVITGTEQCEPGSSEHPCPTQAECADPDPCTMDTVTGSADQCSAQCSHIELTRMPVACNDGNPCTTDMMVESEASCSYECVSSAPREPSGSCVDSDPCTDDTPTMSTTRCAYDCPHRRRDPTAANCADSDPCTDDTPVLSTTRCAYECPHTRRDPAPGNCTDNDPCTDDTPVLSRTMCRYECPHTRSDPAGNCADNDPCTDDTPVLSRTMCRYECPHTRSEPPSVYCVDENPCTNDNPVMSTTSCEFLCPNTPEPEGTECGDNMRCSSDGRCLAPAAVCGNGAVEGDEQCDPAATGEVLDYSCDGGCRRLNRLTPCTDELPGQCQGAPPSICDSGFCRPVCPNLQQGDLCEPLPGSTMNASICTGGDVKACAWLCNVDDPAAYCGPQLWCDGTYCRVRPP